MEKRGKTSPPPKVAVVTGTDGGTGPNATSPHSKGKTSVGTNSTVTLLDLAMLVHELRTPLITILGLNGQTADLDDPCEKVKMVEKIDRVGQHALEIVNDILALSKAQADCVETKQVKVETYRILTDCLDFVQAAPRAKAVPVALEIAPDFPPVFTGNPLRLRQILINLLANAVKFTSHGHITLSASKDTTTRQLCFCVEDTGAGMDEAQVNALFRPFDQLGQHNRGGTGLGLVISQTLARNMGGDLWVTSTKGQGSRFSLGLPDTGPALVEVPSDKTERVRSNVASRSSEPATIKLRKRFLVVDDNDLIRDLNAAVVGRAGHDVWIAASGAEALSIFDNRHFDVVLLDQNMPDMDGMETARCMRSHPNATPKLTIIGLSAVVTPDLEHAALAAGMDAFLLKGWDENTWGKVFG